MSSTASPTPFRLDLMTAAEVRDALSHRPAILLPMGSFEDQGPHVPMGDYRLADILAERIAERSTAEGEPAFVAPVLPFGGADYFGYMPGGIALSQATLRAVIGDMLACLLRHDIRNIIIINGHGGNTQAIEEATRDVFRAHGVLIPSYYLWRNAFARLPHILGPEQAARSAGHGADPLTSIALHLMPERVRRDLIAKGPAAPTEAWGLPTDGFGSVRLGELAISVPLDGDRSATNGIVGGDPSLCSAETGAALCAWLVQGGVDLIRHVRARTDPHTGRSDV